MSCTNYMSHRKPTPNTTEETTAGTAVPALRIPAVAPAAIIPATPATAGGSSSSRSDRGLRRAQKGCTQHQGAHVAAAGAPQSNNGTYTAGRIYKQNPWVTQVYSRDSMIICYDSPGTAGEKGHASSADVTLPTAATISC